MYAFWSNGGVFKGRSLGTGNVGDTNVNETRRLLKQRYATPRNDEFSGSLNTAHFIDYVVLPELAIVLGLFGFSCGSLRIYKDWPSSFSSSDQSTMHSLKNSA